IQARDADPRPLAPRYRRAGARARAGRDRLCARVRALAGDDGPADRRAPADRRHARRHGDEVRSSARAALQGRADDRRGRHRRRADEAVGDGEALLHRRRDGGHDRRGAGARRLRLHPGVPRRADDARREDHADLRRHEPDPEARDRARDAAREPRVSPRRYCLTFGPVGCSWPDRRFPSYNPQMGGGALSHLDRLEAEGIDVLREAVAQAERPVLLYSIGKDSSVLLHLARKAFHPGRLPFPLLHIDTTWKFREMIAFRDATARELGLDLIVHTNPEGLARGINPIASGSALQTEIIKTEALKQALDKYGFDAALGGARRDEEKSRAKERVF